MSKLHIALYETDIIKAHHIKEILETAVVDNNIELAVNSFDRFDPLLYLLNNEIVSYDMVILYLNEKNESTAKYIPRIREVNQDVCLLLVVDDPQRLYDLFLYNISGFVLKDDIDKYLAPIVLQILHTSVEQDKRYFPFEVFSADGLCHKLKIPIFDILFIHVTGGIISLHTCTETYMLKETKLESVAKEMVKHSIIYINRSYLVNITRISMISGKQLTLDNGEVLEISRRQKKNVEQAFMNYFKN